MSRKQNVLQQITWQFVVLITGRPWLWLHWMIITKERGWLDLLSLSFLLMGFFLIFPLHLFIIFLLSIWPLHRRVFGVGTLLLLNSYWATKIHIRFWEYVLHGDGAMLNLFNLLEKNNILQELLLDQYFRTMSSAWQTRVLFHNNIPHCFNRWNLCFWKNVRLHFYKNNLNLLDAKEYYFVTIYSFNLTDELRTNL